MGKSSPLLSVRGLVSFGIASLFLFFEMGVQVSPNVMASSLMHDLNLNATQLGFLSSIYFYSYAGMMIPVGIFYDRFKLNHVMILALLTLGLGNLLFSLAASFLFLALARLLMGFGSAFAFVGVLCVIKYWFPHKYFPFFVGITQFMAAIGAMMGETPVALLVHYTSWRYASVVFFVLSLVLMILIALFVRLPKDRWSAHTHNRREIFLSIKRVLKNKQSYIVAFYAFCSWGPIVILAALWGDLYIQKKFGESIAHAGLLPMIIWITLALTSPIIGRLVAMKYSHKNLMSVTVLIGAVGTLLLLYVPGINYITALLLSMTLGIGAAGQILSFDLVRMNNQDSDFGIATGFNNIGVVFGGVILQPLVGILLDWYKQAGEYTVYSFNHSLWLIPACFIGALLMSQLFIGYKKL